MEPIQWFVVGGILIAALDEIVHQTPWKSNNVVQLVMTVLKAIFRTKS